MWYLVEPRVPSWLKTNDQLLEEQTKDDSRNNLYKKYLNKKIFAINPFLFASKEIIDDLKEGDPILQGMLDMVPSLVNSGRGHKDLLLSSKIDSKKSTFSIIAKTLSGEIIGAKQREFCLNKELFPGAKEKEIQIRYFVDDKSKKVFYCAMYLDFAAKLLKKAEVLRWKKR